MSRPLSFLLAAAVLLAVASCAAHEKAGDRAAAVGDWKTAEREYGSAARKDPSKKELQEKYQQARAAAIDGSSRAATACYAARDFECALAESSYALALNPGRVDVATLRRDAGREAALLRVGRAREASGRGDHRGALGLLLSAREASDDPRVTAAVRGASPAVVDGAVFEAEALRAKEQYAQALELYGAAAQVDPAVQPRLAAVQAEYERWKDSEAEKPRSRATASSPRAATPRRRPPTTARSSSAPAAAPSRSRGTPACSPRARRRWGAGLRRRRARLRRGDPLPGRRRRARGARPREGPAVGNQAPLRARAPDAARRVAVGGLPLGPARAHPRRARAGGRRLLRERRARARAPHAAGEPADARRDGRPAGRPRPADAAAPRPLHRARRLLQSSCRTRTTTASSRCAWSTTRGAAGRWTSAS